jgi:acyl-CoA synthetase (NDP forming)
LPAVAHRVVTSFEEARQAANALGYPVACKTAQAGILHKSDVGGVRLGLADEHALRQAYGELAARWRHLVQGRRAGCSMASSCVACLADIAAASSSIWIA